jgi:hypothetical protein
MAFAEQHMKILELRIISAQRSAEDRTAVRRLRYEQKEDADKAEDKYKDKDGGDTE